MWKNPKVATGINISKYTASGGGPPPRYGTLQYNLSTYTRVVYGVGLACRGGGSTGYQYLPLPQKFKSYPVRIWGK